jgi:hypothetical protein
MPVALPTGGDLATRVTQTAAITRARKTAARGTSAAVLGLPFRRRNAGPGQRLPGRRLRVRGQFQVQKARPGRISAPRN